MLNTIVAVAIVIFAVIGLVVVFGSLVIWWCMSSYDQAEIERARDEQRRTRFR